jgi:hypothetical protein
LEAFYEQLLRHGGHPKAIQQMAIVHENRLPQRRKRQRQQCWVSHNKFRVFQNVVEPYEQIQKAKNWGNSTEKQAHERESMPKERCMTGMT